MFGLFESDNPAVGFVFFKNQAPPPAQAFGYLQQAGVAISPLPADGDTLWRLALEHPKYGTAWLSLKKSELMPAAEDFLRFPVGLTSPELEQAGLAGACVGLVVPAKFKNVLRDRKRMLGFMRLVMKAEDAVFAGDLFASKCWSRESLDEELAHDADLDIEALYVYHAIYEQKDRPYWLHTHGLGELGGFDFDLLRPSPLAIDHADDIFRSLAFAMLEGKIAEATDSHLLAVPNGVVRLVPAGEFMRQADKADRELRDLTDGHAEKRAVVCEPSRKRLLGGDRVEPSQFLCRLDDDNMMLMFTDAASALMGERARGTLGIFGGMVEEFAELPVKPLIKIGCPTPGGSREHIWFEVHGLDSDSADCTCLNEPYEVPSLREGLRSRQPLDNLSDWTIISPAGAITPRNMRGARILRSLPAEARAELIQLKKSGAS